MEYLKRLEESLNVLENSADKLAQVPELLNGIIELTKEIQSENAQYSRARAEMETIKGTIEKYSKEIQDYVVNEKTSRDEFITTMKSTLIQNNKENIQVYETLATTISHRVELAENNMNNSVSTGVETITKNIVETDEKMEKSFETLNADVTEVKSMVPVVQRIQILVIVAVALGLISCILHFI